MNQSWSVIIFAYNEEKTIASVIEKACIFLNRDESVTSEVVIVDDGSTDNSENIIKDIVKSNNNVRYIRHPKNLGIGPTLLTGYKNAEKENVLAIPGDGQFDINELNDHRNFPEKTFLSFYREELPEYSLFRKTVTKSYGFFNKIFLKLNVKDINWVKAFKTKDLKNLDLQLESSLVSSEICAKLCAQGFKSIEILSVYHQRQGGIPRGASMKTLSQAFIELLTLVKVVSVYKKNIKKSFVHEKN